VPAGARRGLSYHNVQRLCNGCICVVSFSGMLIIRFSFDGVNSRKSGLIQRQDLLDEIVTSSLIHWCGLETVTNYYS